MLRFAASALVLLVAFCFVLPASGEAASRSERHRIVKHQKFRMIDRRAGRFDRRPARRVVARAVVVVKVDGGRSFHRRHHQGNSYSGDVVIEVRNGVGQWSYGSYSSSVASADLRPKVKIIDVGTQKVNGACQMQAGVCVIKP